MIDRRKFLAMSGTSGFVTSVAVPMMGLTTLVGNRTFSSFF